jgi:hypothetical protein
VRSFAVVVIVLAVTMAVAAAFFGWGAMIWAGVSGLVWLGAAGVGVVLIVRDILSGARALPSVELLFLSIAGLILSVLVWISAGGTLSVGLVDVGVAGVVVGLVPGLLFAVFVVVSAMWLLLIAVGAYGRRWLTERVVNGMERRGRVLRESLDD